MKITKTQLKEIIKEELERVISEEEMGKQLLREYPDKKLMIALAGLDAKGLTAKADEIKKWFDSAMTWHDMQDYYLRSQGGYGTSQDSSTVALNDLLHYLDIQKYDKEKKQLIKGIVGL